MKFRDLPIGVKIILGLGLVVFTLHGGMKRPGWRDNAGADKHIDLIGIVANKVDNIDDAGSTNTITEVEVLFRSNNVTIETPVQVRMSPTNSWTELEKIEPTIVTDSITNTLAFVVVDDVTNYKYWWVGDDTPAITVETKGIEVKSFVATSKFIDIVFSCDDEKATTFYLQTRKLGSTAWQSVASVGRGEVMRFHHEGFLIGESREWRIYTEYLEGENE